MSSITTPLGGQFACQIVAVVACALAAAAPAVARVQESAPSEPSGTATPPAGSVTRADEGWDLLDGVALAVDDRIMTLDEYFDALDEASVRGTTTTPEQQREIATAIVRGNVTRLLGERAGESLELSDIDVDTRVRDWIREQREEQGQEKYSADLRRRGRDPLDELTRTRREMLGHLWLQRELGGRNSPGRLMVDPYVRPGTLRELYPSWADDQRADFVELRMVELLGDQVAGVEIALAILTDQREQILAGEVDMGQLAFENWADETLKNSRGLVSPVQVSNFGDSELYRFVVENEEGAVSAPLAWGRGGPASVLDPVVGYRLFRIEKKTRVEEVPPFGLAATQDELRERVEQRRERERRATASDRLGQSSMVWIHPLVRQVIGEKP